MLIMKKIFFTITVGMLFVSCQNIQLENKENKETNQERYSTNSDTSYKINSIEIESITRTFYTSMDNSVRLSTNNNGKSIVLTIFDDKNLAAEKMSKKGFFKFLEDAKTLDNNRDKELTFTFGDRGLLTAQFTLDSSIYVYIDGVSTLEPESTDLEMQEFDSMAYCYNRMMEE